MKRSLLIFLTLFSFSFSYAQVIFNEFYVQPGTNHEFFELYNTSTTEMIPLDCYSLIVLYSGKGIDPADGKTKSFKGFYVLDFPKVEIGPLGYLVGAAADPFKYQKSNKAPVENADATFSWNDPGLVSKGGSLKSYRSFDPYTSYTEITTTSNLYDLLFGNGQSASDVKYGFFLFNNGVYVNGFMAGYGSTTVPTDITSMPSLVLTTNCNNVPGTATINWATDVRSGEFVIEVSGSDNGFVRTFDGKCGEWEKSSNPYGSRLYEHSPNETNGAADGVEETNALSITTERTVCGTRIDYSITGIIKNNRYDTKAVFPLVVQLYKDNNKNGLLEAGDSLLASKTIYSASDEFHSFTQYPSPTNPTYFLPLNPADEYIVVFRTALGCIDKIVTPPTGTIQTSQRTYCGNQIDFSLDGANYNAGVDGSLDFTANVYLDTDPTDGGFNASVDQLIPGMSFSITNFRDTVTKLLPAGYEGKNYFVVYTSQEGCIYSAAFKAQPAQTDITATRLHTCGDAIEGDILLVDVTAISGSTEAREFPLEMMIYYDNTSEPAKLGEFDNNDVFFQSVKIYSLAEAEKILRVAQGQPVLLVFQSKRGCTIDIIPSEPSCGALPVTFSSFQAQRNRQAVALKWETLSEQNNRGFNVQRYTKGVWETVAFVFSEADGGKSATKLSYEFNDANSEKGISQYRIQQVDLDGKVSYSAIRSVKGLEQAGTRTVVYPNPSANGKVSVVFEDQGAKAVVVSDLSGRIIRQYRNVLNNVQIEGLEGGMYSIQVTDLSTATSITEKVIIKKR